MSEGPFLEKNRSGKSRHRQHTGEASALPDPVHLEPTSDASVEGVTPLTITPLRKATADFIRSIPTDRDFDATDFPSDTIGVLNRLGLRVLRRDRKGGSHVTITDGHATVRLSHREIIEFLRNELKAYDELKRREAENREEIERIEKEIKASSPNVKTAVSESGSLDVDDVSVVNPYFQGDLSLGDAQKAVGDDKRVESGVGTSPEVPNDLPSNDGAGAKLEEYSQSHNMPAEKLVEDIETLLAPVPDIPFLNDEPVPPETIWVLRRIGQPIFESARPYTNDKNIHGVICGEGKNETFFSHETVIAVLRNSLARLKPVKKRRTGQKQFFSELPADALKAMEEQREATQAALDALKVGAHSSEPDATPDIVIPDELHDEHVQEKSRHERTKRYHADDAFSQLDDPFVLTAAEREVIDSAHHAPDAEEVMNRHMNAVRERTREQLANIGFDERFATEFNISEEELRSIPGFERLTFPQQKLLFENLAQSVYGQIKTEAGIRSKEEAAAREAALAETNPNLLRKIYGGVKEALRQEYNLFSTEQELAVQYKSVGFESHKPLLEFLVQNMIHRGPRVHEGVEGELEVDVVNIRTWPSGPERKAQRLAVMKVNEAAHAFAKIPQSWKEETLGVTDGKKNEWRITSLLKGAVLTERKQGNIYDKHEAAFNEAKEDLAASLRRGGASEKEILQHLLDIDNRVHQLQFIQTDPKAVRELSRIEDKLVWVEATLSLLKKKGGYFALGAVGRSVLGATAGFLGAPAVASAVAGIRSWNKTAADLRDRDRLARMGVADASESALNMVSADSLITKTTLLLRRCYALQMEKDKALTEGDAEESDRLEKEYTQTLSKLSARVNYIQDKEGLQRIVYGTGRNAYVQHTQLLEILGEAAVLVADENAPTRARLDARLEKLLATQDERIRTNRKSYRNMDLRKQVMVAAGFSFAGAAVAHFVGEIFEKPAQKSGAPQTEVPRNEVQKGTDSSEIGGGRGKVNPGYVSPSPESESYNAGAGRGRVHPEFVTPSEYQPNPSAEAVPSGKEKTIFYNIEKGDTLLKIVRDIGLVDGEGKPAMLATLKSLTPDELKSIGIRSGNINLLYPGDPIDIETLQQILSERTQGSAPLSKEDIGDFRGADSEIDSDILNKQSTIREAEVQIPDVTQMENEYPSGEGDVRDEGGDGIESQPVSPDGITKVSDESVDPITKKKAEILEQYFRAKNIPDAAWKEMANDSANAFKELSLLERRTPYISLVHDIFVAVEKPPLTLTPVRGDTVERFMKRIFVEIAKRGSEQEFPPEMKRILNGVHRKTLMA